MGYFEVEIFSGEAEFKFLGIKILKIAIFEELRIVMHVLIIENVTWITFMVRGYYVYEDIWEIEISSGLSFYLSQMIMKIVKPQQSLECL